jgi:hypothetical protein
MATLDPLKRRLDPRCLRLELGLALVAFLAGCSSHAKPSPHEAQACAALAKALANQENDFVARVRAIREQHVLIQEYDRQMIAAIIERRTALQSTSLTEMSVSEEVAGCSGQPLDDLRRQAQQQMVDLKAFLSTFRRALKWDPQGVYIDQP